MVAALVCVALTSRSALGSEQLRSVDDSNSVSLLEERAVHDSLAAILKTHVFHPHRAARALSDHKALRFFVGKLQSHGLPFEQVLIDLHVTTEKARGNCQPTSVWNYASCLGDNDNCEATDKNGCTGICRCNTIGIDECECVKSLDEKMVDDSREEFLKAVVSASKTMVQYGRKVLQELDDALDFTLQKVGGVLKQGINVVKKKVRRQLDVALKTIRVTKSSALQQKKKVQETKKLYFNAVGKAQKLDAFNAMSHEIGVLNGMEQLLAVKNTMKQVVRALDGAANFLLPDMLVVGANYGSSLLHTAGIERVIDYRTREIATFVYGGLNIGTNTISLGAGVSAYLALGWQHSQWCKDLKTKYSGLFRTVDASMSIPGLTNLGIVSLSVGGVAAVSAAGDSLLQYLNPTKAQCCPVWDAIKTLGFSVTGSIGMVNLPVGANTGCTTYTLIGEKQHMHSCSKSMLSFLGEQLKHPANVLAVVTNPMNLLLSFGLTLANERRVADSVCKTGEFPNKCECLDLPEQVACCGDRRCNHCDPLFDHNERTAKKKDVKSFLTALVHRTSDEWQT